MGAACAVAIAVAPPVRLCKVVDERVALETPVVPELARFPTMRMVHAITTGAVLACAIDWCATSDRAQTVAVSAIAPPTAPLGRTPDVEQCVPLAGWLPM
jgi:hypothetical protein